MTLVDIGVGTGAFAAAFCDWFGLDILAVEPSAAMRAQIPRRPGIRVLEGGASVLPLPDGSADGAWLCTVIHHIPDLEAAARDIKRVLAPAPPCSSGRHSPEGPRDRASPLVPETPRRSILTPRLRRRARRSPRLGSADPPLSRFPRHTGPASPSSSPRRIPSAAPIHRCAPSPRRSSSAAKNNFAGRR
jgi:SAM-dependent methyltransferase